ncbi:hypothetical protein QRD89_17845 [Halobacillus sp. ACCC02827]|uniref:hypothetical protein n=1 Tax=Halobacillus sp. ACCC02827 TaxID=3052090 RepID=UPI0025702B69|nr:hypothetical protein [Halobacillus sp. ACCC02827]WJE15562.1 hypothetical protein QRD89_17845 [Halobacillus sp. ACCC02827]
MNWKEKASYIQGESFIVIESIVKEDPEEWLEVLEALSKDASIWRCSSVRVLLSAMNDTVETRLKNLGFTFLEEKIFVRFDLDKLGKEFSLFILRSIHDVPPHVFQKTWQRTMAGSPNAPSTMSMEEQMRNVANELGPTYRDSCLIAYEEEEPIGVLMPHLEPGKEGEGRFFYFGLVPEERGREKSLPLYVQGLHLLKEQFGASYSVGSTSAGNIPMRKVFRKAGGIQTGRKYLYEWRKRGEGK